MAKLSDDQRQTLSALRGALAVHLERINGISRDAQLLHNGAKGQHVELVFGAERQAAQGAIMADPTIATVEDA